MPIPDKDQIRRVTEELNVLEGVIDYADQMINQQQQYQYKSLRRHAYGKTVVIETEKKGVQTFRLSSTPVVYPDFASGYATPHSPVGRLCSVLKPGDEDETRIWGEYRVLEVRLFDRFDGPQFEPNVKNFLRMGVDGDSGRAQVANLRSFLAGVREPVHPAPLPVVKPAAPAIREQVPVTEPPPPAPLLPVDTLLVVDEEPFITAITLEIEPEEEAGTIPERRTEEYYGLSETFYVNRTRDQDAVISRSPLGPMFVEGVAGSGKTSAALGRTKMLADFNANSLVTEAEFRDQAGDKLEWWSGQYAGQFSQESCVGFVRTGELIQYLRETCRRLELPHLPVLEYPELRSRLRQHRKVDRTRGGTGRWGGLDGPRRTRPDTTMAWLRAADQVLASHWSRTLVTDLPTAGEVAGAFEPGHQTIALPVAGLAIQRLRAEMDRLAAELSRGGAGGGFALDRLARRIQEKIRLVSQEVLGRDTLWVRIGAQTWSAHRERDMAEQLVAARVPLYLGNSARLVFTGRDGPVDEALVLLSERGEPLVWNEATRTLLSQGQVRVRDAAGLTLPARAADVEDLYLRLLPEATDRLYILGEGQKLQRLRLERGWGKARLNLVPGPAGGNADEAMEDVDDLPMPAGEAAQGQSTVDRVFSKLATRNLLVPLSYLADAYAAALADQPSRFPDPGLAGRIAEQLARRKLAEEDQDLLLCLAHLIGRGFTGNPRGLSEPDYYQAVFVDEVQDFTEQQVYLMVEQARPEYRAITVVGDIAQKLHNGHVIDIPACFPERAVPRVRLTENLRQLDAPGLAWFSACYRAQLQDGLTGHEPGPELRARLLENADCLRGPELSLIGDEQEAVARVTEILQKVPASQTAAVILNDPEVAASFHDRCRAGLTARMVDAELSQKIDLSRRHIRHFTSVTHAKGLEFDVVIVPYLESYALDDPTHVNRLYVALTRSRRRLVLLSQRSCPTPIFDMVWERYKNTLAGLR